MKIIGIGMNYLKHNKELDGAFYKPADPVIFLMPDSALLRSPRPFFVPDSMGRIDYEAELVARICKLGKGISTRFAHRYYDAFTVGIDFTARQLQTKLRQAGGPWELCKGFDGAAYIGDWVPKAELPAVEGLQFRLDLNGETVQTGCTSDMLYSLDELIAYASKYFTLKTGDLIFTGTPAGIGPVKEADRLEGWLEGRKVLDCKCK